MLTSFEINQNEINDTKGSSLPSRKKHTLSLGNLNQCAYRVLHLDIIIIILS